MTKFFLSILLLQLTFIKVFGQEGLKVVKKLEHTDETVFLHLNKSEFNINEELWFKAYVYNRQNQKPLNITNSLHCEIYNLNGDLKTRGLFLIKDGVANGNIKIDSTFKNNIYYVKSYTSRNVQRKNKNFFITKIKVNNESDIYKIDTLKVNYDLQILPEGGHIVNNVINNIGFKIVNHLGHGVIVNKGRILDGDDEVFVFSQAKLGMGKFKFRPVKEEYKIEVITNKFLDTIQKTIKVKEKGFALSIEGFEKDFLNVKIRKNLKTSYLNNKLTLLIHRDGMFKKIKLNSFQNDTLKNVIIHRDSLFLGVNVLTIFNGRKPILERLVFNDIVDRKFIKKTKLIKSHKNNDSISYILELAQKSKAKTFISVSILPESEAIKYDKENNILSNFYLKPYIKGYIEKSYQYFDENNNNRFKDLDLLLLTQGWSSYDWDNSLEENQVDFITSKETTRGINIKGKVNLLQKNQVLFYGIDNVINKKININVDRSFLLEDLILYKGDKLRFTIFDKKKGVFLAPKVFLKFLNINDEYQKDKDIIGYKDVLNYNKGLPNFRKVNINDNKDNSNEILDNITIKAKLKGIEKVDQNKPFYALSSTKKHKITETVKNTFGTIPNFFRSLGFNVNEMANDGSLELKISARETMTFQGGRQTPTIFVDGVKMNVNDLTYLFNMSLDEVDDIYYDRHGSGQLGGTFGVVTIITKKKVSFVKEKPTFIDKEVKFGYEKGKAYYSPIKYILNNKLDVIDWKPNIIINKGSKIAFLNLKDELLPKKLVFYIEGIDEKGNLISSELKINN